MVTVPGATPVTWPSASTVATKSLLLAQLWAAPWVTEISVVPPTLIRGFAQVMRSGAVGASAGGVVVSSPSVPVSGSASTTVTVTVAVRAPSRVDVAVTAMLVSFAASEGTVNVTWFSDSVRVASEDQTTASFSVSPVNVTVTVSPAFGAAGLAVS